MAKSGKKSGARTKTSGSSLDSPNDQPRIDFPQSDFPQSDFPQSDFPQWEYHDWIDLPENKLVKAAFNHLCWDILNKNDRSIPLYYIHGPAGIGKSLLLSIARDILHQNLEATQVQFSRSQDLNDTRLKLSANAEIKPASKIDKPEFASKKKSVKTSSIRVSLGNGEEEAGSVDKPEMDNLKVWFIDDVQFLSLPMQSYLCAQLDVLIAQGVTFVVSGSGPVQELPFDAKLSSRLSGGISLALPRLSITSKQEFLKNMCQKRNLQLAPDIIDWVAHQVGSGYRTILGYLQRIEFLMQQHPPPLSLEYILQQFQESQLPIADVLEEITRVVAEYFSISVSQIKGSSRQKNTLLPRQIAMYLCRERSNRSLQDIGDFFAGRDHSTVLHACQKIKESIAENDSFRHVVEMIEIKLQNDS